MKKLMIAILLLVGVSNYSQEANAPKNKKNKGSKGMKSPEQRTETTLAKMTAELSLDANQQAQIRPIIVEQSVKMEAMRAQMTDDGEDNAEYTNADKKEIKKKRIADKEATDIKIKAILTPDQFVKYQAMQEAEKAKRQGRHQKKESEE
jgi:periplasmic protein CpxP/Spy